VRHSCLEREKPVGVRAYQPSTISPEGRRAARKTQR
jgi:hypothetical protein